MNGALKESGERRIVKLVRKRQAFQLTTDRSSSLPKMIKAGRYSLVNSNITQDHFPVEREGKKELEVTLFHFNRSLFSEEVISEEEIISEMEEQGFRPAGIKELLDSKEQYPDLKKESPIAALGSVWLTPDGDRMMPFLDWDSYGCLLCLYRIENKWSTVWRFLAVCNV